jgi:hypothetical protein
MNSQVPSTASTFPIWTNSWRSANDVQPNLSSRGRQGGVREKDTQKEVRVNPYFLI